MLAVSVWILKMLLKQALKLGSGGLCPKMRKSLSWSQAGRFRKWQTDQPACIILRTTCSAWLAALWAKAVMSSSSPTADRIFWAKFEKKFYSVQLCFGRPWKFDARRHFQSILQAMTVSNTAFMKIWNNIFEQSQICQDLCLSTVYLHLKGDEMN